MQNIFEFFFFFCTFHYIFQLDTTLYLLLHRYQWEKVSKKPREIVLVSKTTAEDICLGPCVLSSEKGSVYSPAAVNL